METVSFIHFGRCPILTPSGSIGMVLHHDDVYPRKSSGCCASTPRAHPDKELPCGVYHPNFLGWNNVWNMPSISQQTTAQHEDSCRTCTDKKPSGCCETGNLWIRGSLQKSEMIEGSLEVKLPIIWTDEKQSREEAERRERLEERRIEEKE